MDNDKKVIAIDAGNTSVKAGYFNNDCLIEVRRFSLKEIDKLSIWVNSIGNPETVMSSVLSKIETKVILDLFKNCFLISNETKFNCCWLSIGHLFCYLVYHQCAWAYISCFG